MGVATHHTYFKSAMMIGTLIMIHAISAIRVGILIYSYVCLMTSRTTEMSNTFGEEFHINPTMTFGETN
jgi:UDP-glucose 4-epimerase